MGFTIRDRHRAENHRARAGLKIAGLKKPGLQNHRAGRPGPVPIPVYNNTSEQPRDIEERETHS